MYTFCIHHGIHNIYSNVYIVYFFMYTFCMHYFCEGNYLFSSLSKESIDKEQKRHDKAIEDLQQAQIEWAKKRQEQLDYINNEIMKEHKAEKRFMDLNSVMQQYFIVTGRQLEPLPPKPVLSDFYVPSEDHHNRELAFITISMIGIGAFLWYSDK